MPRPANESRKLKHGGASWRMFIDWWRRKFNESRPKHICEHSKKRRSWPGWRPFAEVRRLKRKLEPSRKNGSKKRLTSFGNLKTWIVLDWKWRRFRERKPRSTISTSKIEPG